MNTDITDKALVVTSVKAGLISFGASWVVCTLCATGIFGLPGWNAALGVAVTVATYLVAFKWMTGLPFRKCLLSLGMKEGCESIVRFVFHYTLMHYGLPVSEAAPIAQLTSGGLGHLSTPLFFRASRKFEQRTLTGK